LKHAELQYQQPCMVIPAFREERCRSANDRWQLSHLEVMTLNPAAHAGEAIDWIRFMGSFAPGSLFW
jgi:hypothetical protein